MKLLHLFSFLLSFFLVSSIPAQTTTPDVVASAGGTLIAGDVILDFTIGEVVTDTYMGAQILTQGFQQSNIIIIHVPDEQDDVKFDIYPNPTSDYVILNFHTPVSGTLALYDVNGMVVSNQAIQGQDLAQLDFQAVASGSYLLKVNIEGRITTHHIQIAK